MSLLVSPSPLSPPPPLFIFSVSSWAFKRNFSMVPSMPPGERGTPSSMCEPDQYFFFLYQSDHFAMEMGKQPIIFENPMYATRDSAIKVAQPPQVRSRIVLSFWCHCCWLWRCCIMNALQGPGCLTFPHVEGDTALQSSALLSDCLQWQDSSKDMRPENNQNPVLWHSH